MPRALANIPEIVVGNITHGEVVLRNLVISPHYATDGGGGIYTRPIDSVTPWSPNQTQGQLSPAKQFDTAITPNDFSKLPADTRVVFIDGDEVINASREEAPDFFMNGAYFIGAFAPETADAVIRDMMENPIPSPEEQNVANIVDIFNMQLAFGLSALTYFNAFLDAEEAWEDFEGIDDNETLLLTTPPVPGVQVPQNFPAEREILITYNPDYTGDTGALGRRVYSEIIAKASKAVLSTSERPAGQESRSSAYEKYVLWIPDSVTDLQVLEAIREIMKTNMNVSISTKRITAVDVPVPGAQAPLPELPEQNKELVGDRYQQILEQLQTTPATTTKTLDFNFLMNSFNAWYKIWVSMRDSVIKYDVRSEKIEFAKAWKEFLTADRDILRNAGITNPGTMPDLRWLDNVPPTRNPYTGLGEGDWILQPDGSRIKYGSAVNPQYESLQKQAQVIAQTGGVSPGCQPESPAARPPNLVPQSCLPPRPPIPTPKPKPTPPSRPPTTPKPPGTNSGGIGKP